MRVSILCMALAVIIPADRAAAQSQSGPILSESPITPLHALAFGSLRGPGTPVDAGHPLPGDIVVRGASTDRGAIVGTMAVSLAPANAARRGWAIQVQAGAAASCYVNGQAAATPDYHSLQVGGGGYYQTPDGHVGTGALSVICTAGGIPVYLREW